MKALVIELFYNLIITKSLLLVLIEVCIMHIFITQIIFFWEKLEVKKVVLKTWHLQAKKSIKFTHLPML